MAKQLHANDHQQEQRANQARTLADRIGEQMGGTNSPKSPTKVTLKGEAIEVGAGADEMVITANGDDTFTIKDGASHVSADDVLKQIASRA